MIFDLVDLSYPRTALLGGIPIFALLLVLVPFISGARGLSKLPLINGVEPTDISSAKAKQRFLSDAPALIKAGFAKVCSTNATWKQNNTAAYVKEKIVGLTC
jgi:hypothetical protein